MSEGLNKDNLNALVKELTSADGGTPTLTANILRNWNRDKIKKFAAHLLGGGCMSGGGVCVFFSGHDHLTSKRRCAMVQHIGQCEYAQLGNGFFGCGYTGCCEGQRPNIHPVYICGKCGKEVIYE